MISFKKLTMAFVYFVLLSMILPYRVYAYLDLGTGSYFIQLAIAALLGGLYAVKIFWKNITTFFKKIFSEGKKL